MTYEEFFDLTDSPFRLTPDPDYYFAGPVHSEALQNLLYSIRAGEGFAQITGDPGTGKTVTIHTLLTRLGGDVKTALILHPRLSLRGLLKSILLDFGMEPALIEEKKSKEALLRLFREEMLRLAEQGISPVIIVDEAQNLPATTLEELRLLSNLETPKKKLLQIILVGQRELEALLKRPEMSQLYQRITIRYRLVPFTAEETEGYIRHRLKIAGSADAGRFSKRSLTRIHRLSKGLPRLINIICERAMMSAFVSGKETIENTHLKKAVASITGETGMHAGRTMLRPALLLCVALLCLAAVTFGRYGFNHLPEIAESFRNTAVSNIPEKAGEVIKYEMEKVSEARPATVSAPLAQETAPTPTPTPTPASASASASKDGAAPADDSREDPKGKSATIIPPQVVNIPEKGFIITIDKDEMIARLWEGGEEKSILRKEFPMTWSSMEGVFLLIREKTGREHIFSSTMPFILGEKNLSASALWKEVEGFSPGKALPLLVYSKGREPGPESMEKAGKIRETVKAWARAWGTMDISGYMDFYGDFHMIYRPAQNRKPSVYTRKELYGRTKKIFSRTRSISLSISDPICIVNPSNPEAAMAFFTQKYTSNNYSDKGIKALYLSHTETLSEASPWKIAGRLWIPL